MEVALIGRRKQDLVPLPTLGPLIRADLVSQFLEGVSTDGLSALEGCNPPIACSLRTDALEQKVVAVRGPDWITGVAEVRRDRLGSASLRRDYVAAAHSDWRRVVLSGLHREVSYPPSIRGKPGAHTAFCQ